MFWKVSGFNTGAFLELLAGIRLIVRAQLALLGVEAAALAGASQQTSNFLINYQQLYWLVHAMPLPFHAQFSPPMTFFRATASAASPVDTILDKEAFTLEELLDEDELIQECKSLNTRLITFLKQKETVKRLVSVVWRAPCMVSSSSSSSSSQVPLRGELLWLCCTVRFAVNQCTTPTAHSICHNDVTNHAANSAVSAVNLLQLSYIAEPPPHDSGPNRTFKYPYTCCELFCCEVEGIFNTLLEDDELMGQLFSLVEVRAGSIGRGKGGSLH